MNQPNATILTWVPLAAQVATPISLLLAILQWRHGIRAKKVTDALTLMTTAEYQKAEKKAAKALRKHGINLYRATTTIPEPQARAIIDIDQDFKAVKDYLNIMEGYAAAISAGVVDERTAYLRQRGRFIRIHTIFSELIATLHEEYQTGFWMELQWLAKRWAKPRVTWDRPLRREFGVRNRHPFVPRIPARRRPWNSGMRAANATHRITGGADETRIEFEPELRPSTGGAALDVPVASGAEQVPLTVPVRN